MILFKFMHTSLLREPEGKEDEKAKNASIARLPPVIGSTLRKQ